MILLFKLFAKLLKIKHNKVLFLFTKKYFIREGSYSRQALASYGCLGLWGTVGSLHAYNTETSSKSSADGKTSTLSG